MNKELLCYVEYRNGYRRYLSYSDMVRAFDVPARLAPIKCGRARRYDG